MSRLDEQQRRWCAAVESAEIGHGGYTSSNDRPGPGIDVDERGPVGLPYTSPGRDRGTDRRLDATVVRRADPVGRSNSLSASRPAATTPRQPAAEVGLQP